MTSTRREVMVEELLDWGLTEWRWEVRWGFEALKPNLWPQSIGQASGTTCEVRLFFVVG